mmetsp:Transcript_8690/g.24461  ORF Transcript_8690/g.24461 Transcript_8690/m.24461 type:complete len:159 (-) Transcript_8690:323-799(-)
MQCTLKESVPLQFTTDCNITQVSFPQLFACMCYYRYSSFWENGSEDANDQSSNNLRPTTSYDYRLRFLSPRKLLYRNMTVVDAMPPQIYLTINSWCIHGKSSSHRLKSDRMFNSLDARSACCSMLRIPLKSQLDSPAPRPGVTMSNQILIISSTIAAG